MITALRLSIVAFTNVRGEYKATGKTTRMQTTSQAGTLIVFKVIYTSFKGNSKQGTDMWINVSSCYSFPLSNKCQCHLRIKIVAPAGSVLNFVYDLSCETDWFYRFCFASDHSDINQNLHYTLLYSPILKRDVRKSTRNMQYNLKWLCGTSMFCWKQVVSLC